MTFCDSLIQMSHSHIILFVNYFLLQNIAQVQLHMIDHIYVILGCTGEWWNADTEAVINQALQTGGGPNVSDAYTINGLPGPLYNCSANGSSEFVFGLLRNFF